MNDTTNHLEDQSNTNVAEELSLEDIEAAYLHALETADAAEAFFPQVEVDSDIDEQDESIDETDVCPPDQSVSPESSDAETLSSSVTLAQVIEALLFVADQPSPARKLAEVAGGSTTAEQIDSVVQDLNMQYTDQARPYEIHLVEGGYEMTLQEDFEDVRRRVFGQGPKEVKLNQDGLELLAFVAYTQPVTRAEVEATGKKKAGGILRQLLRRQLIKLERTESGDDAYCTTPRFLELFGLASIEDLPQAEDFAFK